MKNPKPLLLAVCRPPGAIAQDEIIAFAQFGNLNLSTDLQQVQLLEETCDLPTNKEELEKYCAVIITGSPLGFIHPQEHKDQAHIRMENRLDKFVRLLVEQDFPTIAICYGIQAFALAYNGTITRKYPEDLQAAYLTLTEAGKNDPVVGNLPTDFRSYVGHSDAIDILPPEAVVLVRGKSCPIHMVRIGEHVYGTQFHPEITTAGMMIRIDSYGDTYFPAKEINIVLKRCKEADVTASHKIITNFLNRYFHNCRYSSVVEDRNLSM